jgi:hypothetical protein
VNVRPDPLVDRLASVVRDVLTTSVPPASEQVVQPPSADAVRAVLRRIEAYAYEAPVGAGGYDLGVVAGVTVAVELGRSGAPDVYGGPVLLVDAATAAGAGPDPAMLASAVTGDLWVAAAGFDRAVPAVGAELRPGGPALLAGRVTAAVPPSGTRLLLPVSTVDGARLVLTRRAVQPVGGPGEDHARLTLDGAEADLVAAWPSGGPLARARIRHAGYLLGVAKQALTLAVAHTQQRRQFGQRLVDFQAVRFQLAQATVDLRAAMLAVYHAAWLADTGLSCTLEAVEALALATEAAAATTSEAMQLHGAVGLTRSAAVQRYYRIARSEGARYGPLEALWTEAGELRWLAEAPVAPADPADQQIGTRC